MTNEQLAQKYASRAQKCLTVIKVLMICAVVAIAVLIIFAAIAVGVNMQESNPQGMLLGIVIPGMLAVACVIGALAALLTATITINKLKKLGADKS